MQDLTRKIFGTGVATQEETRDNIPKRVVVGEEDLTGKIFGAGAGNVKELDLLFSRAKEMDRARSARVVRLQFRTGLAPDYIDANLDQVERETKDAGAGGKFNLAYYAKSSPTFMKWVQDNIYRGAAIGDDLATLDLEEMARRPATQWPRPESVIVEAGKRLAYRRFMEAGRITIGGPTGTSMGMADAFGMAPAAEVEGPAGKPMTLEEFASSKLHQHLVAAATDELRAEERFIAGKEKQGAFETVGRITTKNPLFIGPFAADVVDAANAGKIYALAKAIEGGTATDDDREDMVRFARLAEADERRGKDIWGKVAATVANMPAFIGSFAFTGGIYSGVKGGILKGSAVAVEATIKSAAKKALSGYGARFAVASATGAGVQTLAASPVRIIAGTLEGMTPGGWLEMKDGTVVMNIVLGSGKPFTAVLPMEVVSAYADVASERLGYFMEFLDKPVNRFLFQSWMKKVFPKSMKDAESFITRFQESLQKGGIHGILGEIGEEEAAKFIEAVGHAPFTGEFSFRLPGTRGGTTPEDLLAEAIAFAPGAAASVIPGREPAPPRIEPDRVANPEFLREITKLAKESKLLKEEPEMVEKVLAEATKGEATEFVRVPFARWNDYWSKQEDADGKPMSPRDVFGEVVGDTASYDESGRTGVDLLIPLSKYLTRLANTEHAEFFQEESKTDPLEATPAEAVEQEKATGEAVKEKLPPAGAAETQEAPVVGKGVPTPEVLAAAGLASPVKQAGAVAPGGPAAARARAISPVEASVRRVHEDIAEKLRAAKLSEIPGLTSVTRRDIERLASLWSERFRTRAAIRGVDPFELYRASGLKIEKIAEAPPKAGDVFQPGEGGEGPLGRTRVSIAGISIGLTSRANLSTFLHETGHVWLLEMREDIEALERRRPEELTEAQLALLADGQAVLDFLGAKSWATVTKEQNEKWAVAVEKYLMEGVAPSIKLRAAFRRFLDWLKTVYSSESALRVTLTPEVREVMDRLVASSEDTAAARARQRMEALFPSPEAAGLKGPQAERYAALLAEARQAGEELLTRVLMERIKRRNMPAWREERERVRAGVVAELGRRPEVRALSVLSTGLMPDGSPAELPSGLAVYKLSRSLLVEEHGKPALDAIPRSVTAKDGVSADVAARDFGFGSGAELVHALSSMFEQERRASPVFAEEERVRSTIAELQAEVQLLRGSADVLAVEDKTVRKELVGGKVALAKKLEALMVENERQSVAELEGQLRDLRERGGVRPTTPTELLPKSYRAAAGKGRPSDEVAQELHDRGIIEEASSDLLYDWIGNAVETVKASKKRRASFAAEARRIAVARIEGDIEGLIQNFQAQDELRRRLSAVEREKRVVERSLAKMQTVEAVADRLADARMESLHPTAVEEEARREEAMQAVHNEEQAKLLHFEMSWIQSNEFATFKKLGRAILAKPRSVEEYRADAEADIAAKPVSSIDARPYQRQVDLAGREAREAFLKGDFRAAAQARDLQLRNHEMYRAAKAARARAEKIKSFTDQMQKPLKQKALGKASAGKAYSFRDAVNTVLEKYGFRRAPSGGIADRLSLEEFVKRHKEETGREPLLPERVKSDIGIVSYKSLTLERLEEIYAFVKNIEYLAATTNKMLSEREQREFDDLVNTLVAGIVANSKGEREFGVEGEQRMSRQGRLSLIGMMSLIKNTTRYKQMDGWKDGEWVNAIVRGDDEAANLQHEMTSDTRKKLKALREKHLTPEMLRRMNKKEFIPELGASMDREAILMIVAYMGLADSREQLKEGLSKTLGRPIGDAELQAIVDRLSKGEMDYLQGVWDLNETFWPRVKALAERVNGIAPEHLERAPITTKFGVYAGGYVGLKFDETQPGGPVAPVLTRDDAIAAADRSISGASVFRMTKHGHRIERTKHRAKPLKLSLSVITSNLQEVIHDLAYYEHLVDVNRILYNPKIRDTIIAHYGSMFYRQLTAGAAAVAAGGAVQRTQLDSIWDWLRRGLQIAKLAGKASVGLMQTTGLTQSVVALNQEGNGAYWVARGIGRVIGDAAHLEATISWVKSLSSMMRTRADTQFVELAEEADQLRGRGLLSNVRWAGMQGIVQVQMIVDTMTWVAGYERALEIVGYDKATSEEDAKARHDKAVFMADRAVIDSQGSGNVKDLAAVQRDSALMKLLVPFYSWGNVRINLSRQVFGRTKTVADVPRALNDLMFLYAVPAAAVYLFGRFVTGRGPGGDDDDMVGLFEAVAREPFADLPLIRDTVTPYEYRGPAGFAGFAAVKDVIKAGGALDKAIKEGEVSADFVKKVNRAAGPFLGYPSDQIENTVRGLIAVDEGTAGPGAIIFGPPSKK